MAKVINNIIAQGLSGSLGGQIVFKKDKAGRTIVSAKPTFSPNRTFTTGQLGHQKAFREASAYAKTSKGNIVYIQKAQGTPLNAYNAALADWFNKPQVLEIDTQNWNGAMEQIIRVQAQDDTRVTKVHVKITDTQGSVLEEGDAVQADGLWWEYATSASVADLSTAVVTATAHDLPGNSHILVWQNN